MLNISEAEYRNVCMLGVNVTFAYSVHFSAKNLKINPF